MDIIVEGTGTKSFKPNKITLSFEFKTKDKSYEKALDLGVSNVDSYLNVLKELGFEKEQLKTKSFRVSEDRVYDEQARKYNPNGFIFNQSARLEFAYDMKKLSNLMERTSKESNPPTYRIDFGVKNDKEVEDEVLALAYKEAEFYANSIAKASNKKIVDCKKTSFEPFTDTHISSSRYETDVRMEKCCSATREKIQNIFVPEDVEISKTLYCLFIAE